MMQKETLTSMAVQRREKEKHEERKKLNRKMKQRQVDAAQRQYNQSIYSTTDPHMANALAKVRENKDVSIPHTLARFHGTTIYQKPSKG